MPIYHRRTNDSITSPRPLAPQIMGGPAARPIGPRQTLAWIRSTGPVQPLFQSQFVIYLLLDCITRAIHRAIENCAHVWHGSAPSVQASVLLPSDRIAATEAALSRILTSPPHALPPERHLVRASPGRCVVLSLGFPKFGY